MINKINIGGQDYEFGPDIEVQEIVETDSEGVTVPTGQYGLFLNGEHIGDAVFGDTVNWDSEKGNLEIIKPNGSSFNIDIDPSKPFYEPSETDKEYYGPDSRKIEGQSYGSSFITTPYFKNEFDTTPIYLKQRVNTITTGNEDKSQTVTIFEMPEVSYNKEENELYLPSYEKGKKGIKLTPSYKVADISPDTRTTLTWGENIQENSTLKITTDIYSNTIFDLSVHFKEHFSAEEISLYDCEIARFYDDIDENGKMINKRTPGDTVVIPGFLNCTVGVPTSDGVSFVKRTPSAGVEITNSPEGGSIVKLKYIAGLNLGEGEAISNISGQFNGTYLAASQDKLLDYYVATLEEVSDTGDVDLETMLSSTNSQRLKQYFFGDVVKLLYPIGSYYMASDYTINPADEIFKIANVYTKWERVEGRYLAALGGDIKLDEFNRPIGGSKNIPAHSHSLNGVTTTNTNTDHKHDVDINHSHGAGASTEYVIVTYGSKSKGNIGQVKVKKGSDYTVPSSSVGSDDWKGGRTTVGNISKTSSTSGNVSTNASHAHTFDANARTGATGDSTIVANLPEYYGMYVWKRVE